MTGGTRSLVRDRPARSTWVGQDGGVEAWHRFWTVGRRRAAFVIGWLLFLIAVSSRAVERFQDGDRVWGAILTAAALCWLPYRVTVWRSPASSQDGS